MADGSVRLDVDLDVSKADKDLAKLKDKIAKLETEVNKNSQQKGLLEEQMKVTFAQLDEAIDKVKYLKEKVSGSKGDTKSMYKGELAEAVEDQKALTAEANRLNAEYDRVNQKIGTGTEQLGEMKEQAGLLAKSIEETRASDKLSKALSNVKTMFSKIVSTAFGAVKNIGSKIISTSKGILGGILAKVKGALSKTSDFSGGFKSGLKHVLAYGIGIKSLFALFNRLRSYIKDAVTEFASADTETKSNIDSLKASLNTLKLSWGAAFAPVLSLVTPALNTLISMLTRAANAIAALFSALTGKGGFKAAASGAQALADATKSAGGAAKEAKKQLMGFDELNILSNDDGGGGSGGAGTEFKDQELPDWAEDIAKLIKDGEFVELGRQLANGLWNAINSIDFASLGARFGTILNSIMQVGASFITTFPWQDLGMLIGSFINNAIGNINFYNLGIIIASKLYIALNLAAGLLKSIDWASVTQALLTTIHGIIYGVDWAQLAVDLVEGFKNVFSGATDTLINTDWAAEGERLKEVITKFFENVDAASLASDISDFFITLFNSGADLLSGLNGDGETGRKLGDFLTTIIENIDWAGLATSLWSLFSNGISLAAEALSTLAGNLVADLFDALKSAIDSDGDGTISWSEIGKALIDGLAAGIDLIFTKPIEWVRDHIFTPFINGFKEAFGIHSPSTVMKEQGDYIMQGLLDGITDKVQAVIDKFGEIKEGIQTKMEEAKTAVSDAIESIKTFFSNFSLSDIHINMPHFSVQWNAVDSSVARFFGIDSLPSLVVDWYARGGIVDGATLIGAGEDGKEAIVPLERNTEWINMVADGLIERFTQRSFIDQLVDAFVSTPMPAMATGSIAPPRALTGASGSQWNIDLLNEIKALRSEIYGLASQPVQVSSKTYLDKRQIGESVTEYQRETARANGR